MDKRVKRQWLRALRSGDYEQGEGQLVTQEDDDFLFCCLGVLQNLYHLEKNQTFAPKKWKLLYPDKIVLRWAKLKTGRDADESVSAIELLADMNDSGYTFKDIADYIEKNL